MTTEPSSSSIGVVKVEGEYATLVFERHLHYSIDVVWQAITDPSALSKWYLPDAAIEGRTGGQVEFSYSGPFGVGRVTGSILVWDPPFVFEHEWITQQPGSTKMEFGVLRWELLIDENKETILKLTHQKLPRRIAHNFAPGIHAILDRLGAFLDNSPMPDWMERREKLQSSYRVGIS